MSPMRSKPKTVHLQNTSFLTALQYLQLGPEDKKRLREIRPAVQEKLGEFVEIFYNHLLNFPPTAKFLSNTELVSRLKEMQSEHLDSMLKAEWNEQYAEKRFQVGDVHAQVGIDPSMFLGAYNQYLVFMLRTLAERSGLAETEYVKQITSLLKVVLFDISLTLEAYFFHSTQALRSALDMFWKANAELRQFAQFTSHDLKTPLATMANLCDEVLDEFGEEIPSQARELISSARSRAFRMSKDIDELLATSVQLRDESAYGAVSLGKALDEAVDRVRPILDQKKIKLTLPTTLCNVKGDKIKIREALYNIISNATKYIEREPGEITIKCFSDGSSCILSITDNGPGIPPDELVHIFAPFRRLTEHLHKPGSGLGLYFVKSFIEQLGGQVWAESELSKGSTFYVKLPLYNE